VFEAVPQGDHHAIAPGHPEAREASSKERHLTGQVLVAQPPRAINDGIGGRPSLRGALEKLGKRHGTSQTSSLFVKSRTGWPPREGALLSGNRAFDEAISGIASRS